MNPNIASVQTNPAAGSHADSQADRVYFMPVTPQRRVLDPPVVAWRGYSSFRVPGAT